MDGDRPAANTARSLQSTVDHPLYTDPVYSTAMRALDKYSYSDVPRDGNCFYRSYAELVYSHLAAPEVKSGFFGLTELFDHTGASPAVYETYVETMEDILAEKPVDAVEEGDWMPFVGYLRLAVASYIKRYPENFQPFLAGTDPAIYAVRHVERMGERAGELEMMALGELFPFKLRVVSVGRNACTTLGYGDGPEIYMLHTPDHFEPLHLITL